MAPLTASGIFAVGAKLRVAGLYSSAFVVPPAATSTFPLGSSVAVCPDWATPSGPVATNVFGGPSPPAIAAFAVVASTGKIRPETRAPVHVITAMRWRAKRDRFITKPMPSRRSTQDNPIHVKHLVLSPVTIYSRHPWQMTGTGCRSRPPRREPARRSRAGSRQRGGPGVVPPGQHGYLCRKVRIAARSAAANCRWNRGEVSSASSVALTMLPLSISIFGTVVRLSPARSLRNSMPWLP